MLNKLIRWLILLEICLFTISLAPSLILFWVEPFHHSILLHLSVYAALVGLICFFMLLGMTFAWCIFNLYLSLGAVVLNKTVGTVRANGRLRPIGALEAILVKHGPKRRFATGFSLQLIWKEDEISTQMPRWKRVVRRIGAKSSVLGTFRREENADKMAEAVAEFAGIPVRREIWKK